ncbi:hypothetical protein ALI144C_17765 [Actinosynnema sp. ALI-1.44]|uniref:acyltransferase family protein n=1 Tax=Actinosynnema sp. ALI-1.44 TaxID=1933779 RepID=UPI00097C8978|nr:acyltransferase [Actinosynnema sp. ALI-1.44]ONI82908.1 hypothetical protein ALI144C_17765 [Actinosynnema sp. ALI-1.44]
MSSLPAAPATTRLPTLTGMRFFAAILVFVCHAFGSRIFLDDGVNDVLSDKVSRLGWVGVSFFFILSGFVLTWTARPGDTVRRFWRRRMVKIFPNHLATWAVATIFMVVAGTATFLSIGPSALLIQAWFPVETITYSPNDPAWSLCAELVFYLSFPWLLKAANKIRAERLWLAAGVTFAVLALVPLLAKVMPDAPEISYYPGVSWYEYWFVYCLPIARVPEFVLGILMARIVMTGRWIPVRLNVAMLTLIPGFALMVVIPDVFGLVAPTAIPLALIVAAGATADIEGLRSPFRGRIAVWLGEISFAFYMVHMLVLQKGPLSAGTQSYGAVEALGLVALSLVIAVFIAWLLFRFVEAPAMRRWSRPKTKAGKERKEVAATS